VENEKFSMIFKKTVKGRGEDGKLGIQRKTRGRWRSS
jgi:hypothetical protein